MPFKKIFLCGIFALISFSALAQPHVVMGSLHNFDGGYPNPNCIIFRAWMTARPLEILTQNSDGCGVFDTLWFVNTGSFPTEASNGEELTIFFRDTCSAETLTVRGNITLPGAEENWGPFYLQPEIHTITLTAPNGGDTYFWDDPINITWTSVGGFPNVRIQYSPNGGTDWTDIIFSTPNDGLHPWTAPHITSTNVLFKVIKLGAPTVFDISDGFTTIRQRPSVRLTYPNGGERLIVGQVANVAWTTAGAVGNLELHLSRNNGATWSFIAGGLTGGVYNWTITGPPSGNCLMRIRQVTDHSIFDISDAVFAIDTADAPIPPDTIPPSAILDLHVIAVEPTRARLGWTAPGDDGGVGIATSYQMTYDLSPFTWPGSFNVPGMPAPLPAGTVQSVWVEGLTPETNYWAAMVSRDEVPNISSMSNMVDFRTPAVPIPPDTIPPDTIPPSAFVIDTMTMRAVPWDRFTIYWIAPGDDGNVGTADRYDFRLSTTAMTPANFASMPEITTGVPVPQPAGSRQSLTVAGLIPSTTYWIAGRALDEVPNVGPISNILRITTSPLVDIIPPARITTLTCGNSDVNAIEIIFTATGDDSLTGTVGVGFEVRVQAGATFDPMDWEFVPFHAVIPAVPPGTIVRYRIAGLSSGRQYFIGVRAIDNDGPPSWPSNIIGCWTLGVVNPIPDLVMFEDAPDTLLPPLRTVFNPPIGLTYRVSSSEPNIHVSIAPGDRVLVHLAPNFHGEGWIVITASDGDNILYDSVRVTVISVNDPPIFVTFPADTLLLNGFPWSYMAYATDADGDLVTYSLVAGPLGMRMDIAGYLRWLAADIEGVYRVIIAAHDSVGPPTLQEFNLVVIKRTHTVFMPQNLEALDGFRACIPVVWDAPPAVRTGLPVHLSHYRLLRSNYFDVGYAVIADSIIYNTYCDRSIIPGRLYFYKVQAVYKDPDFFSGFSNIDGGVALDGNWLYSNYSTAPLPLIDGDLNEPVWSDAVRAWLDDYGRVLLANNGNYLFLAIEYGGPLREGFRFRFFFDDDNSETWDDSNSTEGYYEMYYAPGMPSIVYFNRLTPSGPEPVLVSSGAFCAWQVEGPSFFNIETIINIRLLEELFALPPDTFGVAFQILNEFGTVIFNWPIGINPTNPAVLGKLMLGSPGGLPVFHVSPPILLVDLETGWETDATITLTNSGDGTVIWSCEEFAPWMSLSSYSGNVPPRATVHLNAHFIAGLLDIGLYESNIRFATNDPVIPERNIPVFFRVTPRVPRHYLEIYPPERTNANPGDIIQVPIYVGDLYDNEIYALDFTIMTDRDFLTPIGVLRGPALPSGWNLIVRNIFSDRVLLRLSGTTPLPASGEVVKIRYSVNPDVLPGRTSRIDITDFIVNYGLAHLPIPVPGSGVLVIGSEIRYFWHGLLKYYNSSWEKQDSMTFGLLDASTGNYDRGIDDLNIPPFPGLKDGWFLSDDFKPLGIDIRPTGGLVQWTAFFEEDGYIAWDKRQMWDGLKIDGWVDMTVDSTYIVSADVPVIITFNTAPGSYTWNIDVKRGWNLISPPMTATSMSVSALFPTSLTSNVWWWDNSIGDYVERTTIETGKAYWLLSRKDTTYTRSGNAVYFFTRNVTSGWIMLGSPAHRTYLADQTITPSDAFLIGTFYRYITSPIPRYEPVNDFVPGMGQWVYCRTPATVKISCIYLPKEAPSVEKTPLVWGRLYLDNDPSASATFAMVGEPMDYPLPPSMPGATNRIYFEGFMPLYRNEISPAKIGAWTGVIEMSNSGNLAWELFGDGDFEAIVDGKKYNMSEIESIPLSPGYHTFKISVRMLPEEIALLQNVPNPFNSATELRFALPVKSSIELSIYDVSGRKVRTMLKGDVDAGYHRAVWDGRDNAGLDLPSGVYFSVLKTEDKSISRKLLLVK